MYFVLFRFSYVVVYLVRDLFLYSFWFDLFRTYIR